MNIFNKLLYDLIKYRATVHLIPVQEGLAKIDNGVCFMGTQLDIDDVAAQSPLARKELDELRNKVDELQEELDKLRKKLKAEGIGVAVLVSNEIKAWFPEFTEEVRNWCTENYFGQWLTLPAYEPSIKPFTKEELQRIEDVAAMLETKLRIRYSEEAVTLNAHDGYSVYATPKL